VQQKEFLALARKVFDGHPGAEALSGVGIVGGHSAPMMAIPPEL